MEEHQEHFGRSFYKDKKTGYWISTDHPRTRAHRWVWFNIYGKIPKSFHIHHKDQDKSNNEISNLMLMHPSVHMNHHYTEEKRQMSSANCDRIRHLTKEWHASPEGRAWHSYHAIKSGFGNWEPTEYKCECCCKEFKSKNKSNVRFCSNNCKSKWRRDSGIDDIDAICLKCNKSFKKNKYSKCETCSESCAAKLRWDKRR